MEKLGKKHEATVSPEARIAEKSAQIFMGSFAYFETHGKLPEGGVFAEDRFDATDRLLDFLECSFGEERLYTEAQRIRSARWMSELHRFVKETRRDPTKRKTLEPYLHQLREVFFSVSPNIFNCLTMEDQLVTSARFSRLPETQGNIGWINIGELVYNLTYMKGEPGHDPRVAFLQKAFDQASPEARLDLIHYLTHVGHDAFEQDWALEVGHSIVNFLKRLDQDETQSPFVHYVAEMAHETLSSDFEEPRMRRNTAWREQMRQENNALGTRIAADKTSYTAPILRRISRDAVASFDRFFVPQSFAWAGKDVDTPREHVPTTQDLDSAAELLMQPIARSPRNLPRMVELTELHFELFENVIGNEKVKQKGASETIDVATLLQELHQPQIRAAIEEEMGISLADLSLREQTQLLSYLARVDAGTTKKGFRTIREHGLNGARTFLSCEYGKDYGDSILKIAQKAGYETAAAIFRKYCEIADIAERETKDLVSEVFEANQAVNVDRGIVNEELLSRAKDCLAACAAHLGKKSGDAAERVLQELERYKSDMLLLASVFKTAYKGKEDRVDFSALKGLSVVDVDPQTLAPPDRKKMFAELKDVLMENWKDKGVDEAQFALHGLEEGFNGPKGRTRFYTLRKAEETIAFLRFDARPDIGPDVVYAGSFNVQPGLRGAALGSALFHRVLDHEANAHRIQAHVLASDRVASSYVEDFGFAITGVEHEKHAGGQTSVWFAIERDDQRRSTKESAQKKTFDLPREQATMLAWIEQITEGGKNIIDHYSLVRTSDSGTRAIVGASEVSELFSEAA